MENMKWINSSDLENWANTNSRDCEENLPYLLRILIRESIPDIEGMRFPAGDSIRHSGWDGILDSTEDTQHIPSGKSYWEMGTSKDIIQKANDDYKKRTDDPNVNHRESTFLFVTPRIWEDSSKKGSVKKTSKNDWLNEKNSDRKWKDIRVLDARDLEEWLEKCPVAARWLANHLNKYPTSELETLTEYWDMVTIGPKFKIPFDIVLKGREESIEKVTNWIKGDYSRFALEALSKEEAILFFCALILSLGSAEKDFFTSKCLIVNNKSTLKELMRLHKNHMFILNFDDFELADYASSLGNHVLIPLSPESSNVDNVNKLRPIEVANIYESLKKEGFDDQEALRIAKDSGKSISILRRLLKFAQPNPSWASTDKLTDLLPFALIGKWDEKNVHDISILERLCGLDSKEISKTLVTLKNSNEPPIYNIGNIWSMRSQYDSIQMTERYLSVELLDEFLEVAFQVLSEPDPEFKLDEDERYKASIFRAVRKYSQPIRKGILNSIILLSLIMEEKKEESKKAKIENLLSRLLTDADDERWFSVSSFLPELAEATPEVYMDCLSKSLEGDNKPIMTLFKSGTDALVARCNHAGLLWSLELLAWEEKYLMESVQVLTRLARLDPHLGNYTNRPINSLREIFVAWMPNTTASLENRLKALELIFDEDNEIAFELLLRLLPKLYDIANPTYKPRWRSFSESGEIKVSIAEKSRAHSEFLKMAILLADQNPEKIAKLVPFYDDLYNFSDRSSLLVFIKNSVAKLQGDLTFIKEALRNLISRHRTHANSQWVLSEAELTQLEEIYGSIAAGNTREQSLWLFSAYYPELMEKGLDDMDAYHKILNEKRTDAIQDLYSSHGIESILDLAKAVKETFALGEVLGLLPNLEAADEVRILSFLEESNDLFQLARGYVYAKIRESNENWIEDALRILERSEQSEIKIANFLMLFELSAKILSRINGMNTNIQKLFWSKFSGLIREEISSQDTETAYGKLLEHNNYITALTSAYMYPKNISNEMIIRILYEYGIARESQQEHIYVYPNKIVDLFKELDKRYYHQVEELEKLEWMYASELSDELWGRKPMILHRKLQTEPEYYIELIRYVFKPKDDEALENEETKDVSKEEIEIRSKRAWDILDSFTTLPGASDGKVDYEVLKKWIDEVRELAIRFKRADIVYDYIGRLLSNCKPTDGVWPCPEVCKILEHLDSKIVDTAFIVAEFNKRGSYTKSHLEGGEQERNHAREFSDYLKTLNPKFIHCSRILKQLQKRFERDAFEEDIDAEQRSMDL